MRRPHYFTGDGMVHGIRLEDGRAVWYRNRWVRTPDVAVALGERERPLPGGRENDRGAVNTNVVRIGGRMLALVEAGSCPVELTDELDTEESTDLGGTLAGSFSAHPKLDPSTGRWHAITYHWTEEAVHHVVVGPSGEVERDVVVATQGSPMVHDTAITATNILIFDLPVRFDRDEAIGGVQFPYHWYPAHAARVGVLPLDGEAADVRWCEVPQAFVFHTVNAVDLDGGRVAVDVVRSGARLRPRSTRTERGPDAAGALDARPGDWHFVVRGPRRPLIGVPSHRRTPRRPPGSLRLRTGDDGRREPRREVAASLRPGDR